MESAPLVRARPGLNPNTAQSNGEATFVQHSDKPVLLAREGTQGVPITYRVSAEKAEAALWG